MVRAYVYSSAFNAFYKAGLAHNIPNRSQIKAPSVQKFNASLQQLIASTVKSPSIVLTKAFVLILSEIGNRLLIVSSTL